MEENCLEGTKEDASISPPAFAFIGNAHLITVRQLPSRGLCTWHLPGRSLTLTRLSRRVTPRSARRHWWLWDGSASSSSSSQPWVGERCMPALPFAFFAVAGTRQLIHAIPPAGRSRSTALCSICSRSTEAKKRYRACLGVRLRTLAERPLTWSSPHGAAVDADLLRQTNYGLPHALHHVSQWQAGTCGRIRQTECDAHVRALQGCKKQFILMATTLPHFLLALRCVASSPRMSTLWSLSPLLLW